MQEISIATTDWTEAQRVVIPYAVITGGSEGLGFALARRIAKQGMAVLLVARRREVLDAAAREIGEAGHAKVAVLALDITDPCAAQKIEAHLDSIGGRLELLVNNAGVGQSGAFIKADAAELDRLVALNVRAPTALMRHFLPQLCARNSGGVINMASLGGYVPGPFQAAYYASKAYLISLSEALAHEASRAGVRVLVVAPGPVMTQFHARMGADNALYRWMIPASSPDLVANWTLLAYNLGLRATVPGLFNSVFSMLLRVLPHRLVIPLVAWLLWPRGRETRDA